MVNENRVRHLHITTNSQLLQGTAGHAVEMGDNGCPRRWTGTGEKPWHREARVMVGRAGLLSSLGVFGGGAACSQSPCTSEHLGPHSTTCCLGVALVLPGPRLL